MTAIVWDETKHPRDPGGEGGGQWIRKTSSAMREPLEEAPWPNPGIGSAVLRTMGYADPTSDLLFVPNVADVEPRVGNPVIWKGLYEPATGRAWIWLPSGQKGMFGQPHHQTIESLLGLPDDPELKNVVRYSGSGYGGSPISGFRFNEVFGADDVAQTEGARKIKELTEKHARTFRDAAKFAREFQNMSAAYDPNQPRDPGGEGGGQWVRVGAGSGVTRDETGIEEKIRAYTEELYRTLAASHPDKYPYVQSEVDTQVGYLMDNYWEAYEPAFAALEERLAGIPGVRLVPRLEDYKIEQLAEGGTNTGDIMVKFGSGDFAPDFGVWFLPALAGEEFPPDAIEVAGGALELHDVLDIADPDFFPAGEPDLAGRYADALDDVRGIKREGFITLHRGMSAAEADAWIRGEEIPTGKFFTSDRTSALAQDIAGEFPELYSWEVARRDVVETDAGVFQLRRPAKLKDKRIEALTAAAPTLEWFNGLVAAERERLEEFEPKLRYQYERIIKRLGRQIARRFRELAPDTVAVAAAFDPNQPRDPGGEGGGQWIAVGAGEMRLLPADDEWTQLVKGARMRVHDEAYLHERYWGKEGVLEDTAGPDNLIVRLEGIEGDWPMGYRANLPRRELDMIAHPGSPVDETTQTAMRLWRSDFSSSLALKALVEGREPAPAYRDTYSRELAQALDKGLEQSGPIGRQALRIVPGPAPAIGSSVRFSAASAGFDRDMVEDYRRTFLSGPADAATVYKIPSDARGLFYPDGQEAIIRGDFDVTDTVWNAERNVWEVELRSTGALTSAATPASWGPPTVEQLLAQLLEDVTTVIAGPTATNRRIFEKMVDGILRRLGMSFDIRSIISQAILNGLAARAEGVLEGIRIPTARIIANSWLNGLSVPQTAEALVEGIDGIAEWQATQLARNDLVGMSNGGSLLAAQMVNAKFPGAAGTYKEWLATDDERTRPTHNEAHGQRVPLETPFVVGGAPLQYPGDPSGPDGEVINCRCTLIYYSEPKPVLTAAFREQEHPRDPGGDAGGEFIKKGTTATDEGTEEEKSEGHLLFADKWEYFEGPNGDIYRAPITAPIGTTGFRQGARFEFPKSQIAYRQENGVYPFTQQTLTDVNAAPAPPAGAPREAAGETLEEMLDSMGANELEGGQERHPERYMKHPKSGFMVEKPGVVYQEATSPILDDDGWGRQPPRIRDVVHGEGFAAPEGIENVKALGYGKYQVGEPRPPDYVFRAISEDEWLGIQQNGYIQSDQRMNLTDTEGTVTALSDPSYYLPGALASDKAGRYEGRVIRIRYRDEDGWRHDRDGYVKTSQPIPMSQIDLVTPKLKREVTPRPGKDWNDIGPVVRASLVAAKQQARYPKGTEVDPSGKGPGGGRFAPQDAAGGETTLPQPTDIYPDFDENGEPDADFMLPRVLQNMQGLSGHRERVKAEVVEKLTQRLDGDPDWHPEALEEFGPLWANYDREAVFGQDPSVDALIVTWSHSASDSNLPSLLVQQAVADEFGLEFDANDLIQTSMEQGGTDVLPAFRKARADTKVYGSIRAFVRAQYAETQEYLAAAGEKDLLVWRGMSMEYGREFDGPYGMSVTDFDMNPASSWAINFDQAHSFAYPGGDGMTVYEQPLILGTRVPNSRILSTALTGQGCLPETEVLVIGAGHGAKDQAYIFASEPGREMAVYDEESFRVELEGFLAKKKPKRSKAKAAAYAKKVAAAEKAKLKEVAEALGEDPEELGMTLHLDERLHNADWPKRTPDMPDWTAFLKKLTPAQRKKLPAAFLPITHGGLTASAFDETKVTRDPGGKAGGQFIKKGTAGVDEGTEEEKDAKQPYPTPAATHGYLTTGFTFERTAKNLLAPYKTEDGYLPTQIPPEAVYKNHVAEALLEKLEGDPEFAAMVEQFKEMPAWTRWDVELHRGFSEVVAYEKYIKEHGSSAGWNSSMAVKPSDMEIGVAMAVGTWAATSSDQDVVSLSMQQAAMEEFALTGISETLKQNLGKTDPTIVAGGRKFLRAQYELTQQFFKDAGVTEVEGFRGVRFKDVKQPFKLGEQMAEITFNPLSSFSIHYDTALDFARKQGQEQASDAHLAQAAMIAQSIPVTKILSTPFTGFGCWSEGEMVVLGDTSTAYVHAWQPEWEDAAAEDWIEAKGHPPATGDGFFLAWRDRRHPDKVG